MTVPSRARPADTSGPRLARHQRRLRLLLLDGTPGAAALLVLATHRAIPGFDAMLIPDTGAYPARLYRYLDRLARIAAEAGTQVLWVDAGVTPALSETHTSLLPLYTRTAEGTHGRMVSGCAYRQSHAVDAAIADLLGYPSAATVAAGVLADCVLGLGAEQPQHARPATARYRRNRYPLVELGWSSADCRAYLHHHELAHPPDMACTPCPNRTNASWAELRATDPQAWQQAVALDAALRHGPQSMAPCGMPQETTCYLHPERVPLDQADLDAERTPRPTPCVPWACRGTRAGTEGVVPREC
ncbi:hypothetical protein F4561_001470 [Lipingzhangella halophila]|uniref:3'-phosphoadenosine 5'-phosphosulfate sulfotransferase (PAPS reductase)/FAD synthetase n=1 Tax=Lipingzhangella halophila TaxID=1783352 RepID=A0A7W7RF25_9ACTN|nr:hypothetical protein [Lipingzhangella halophila]MBB4930650.1 hypothetical protein [Lipingzhangella halophila]